MAASTYEQLDVWQQAMGLVTTVYSLTTGFPREEQYGLTSQIRRAAVSVPSNVAEGQGRRSIGEFLRHLSFARGSLMELRTQAEIARRLCYLTLEQHSLLVEIIDTVGRLLNGLIRALDEQSLRSAKPKTSNQ